LLIYQPLQKEKTKDDRDQAEKSQYELAGGSVAQLHTEGHALILYEMELEPGAYNVYFFAIIEMRLDVELGSLVDENDEKDYEERRAVFHFYGFGSVKDKEKGS
jgi:hypothetical protein